MITKMDSMDKARFSELISYHRTVRFRGIKRVIDNEIVAMVGFDDWTPNSVQMHVWSSRGLSRDFISECFRYAFSYVGIAFTTVRCNNTASLELTRRLGFRQILIVKDGYALGTDLAIQEMRREECRWIRQEVPKWAEKQILHKYPTTTG